jgi:rhodanese-related sulfurtransferase
MKRKIWLSGVVLALLALSIAACGGTASTPEESSGAILGYAKNADGYADISAQQLVELLEKEEVTLVNVHIPYEGELPETDLFIPYDEIADYQDQLPDKDAPVVLYCRSGSMSTSAAQDLVSLGYSNVLELDGGFRAWQAAGYELLDENR